MQKPEDESTRSVRAIRTAIAPWAVVVKKGGEVDTSRFSVDQRDPQNPIVIYPITEEWKGETKILGLAGLILDPVLFQEKVLPEAIEASLPSDFRKDYVVTVRDAAEQLVWPSDVLEEGDDEAWRTLSFVFTDWSIGLRARHQTSEQLAKANFAYNITLSLVLGLVLMAGIVWALRTASTEMKLSEMKSDFVSNVSHELRTPLTQLINNILDFSKIESGRKQYQFEETDLEEVVEGALKIFDVRLQHSGFQIDYRGPVAELPRIQVDPGAIGQALCNLLDNAVKYSGDEREIRVSLGRSNGSVAIAVSDHGIGISEEEQQHIFDRFHRVSTGLVHDVKGSGLGLSIVQHVVQAHGGRIAVESEEGHGATFTIYLPIEGDRSTADGQSIKAGESDLGWQRP